MTVKERKRMDHKVNRYNKRLDARRRVARKMRIQTIRERD